MAGATQAPQAAIGALRFHPDTLQRALADQALGLILPPALHISFQPPHQPHQLSSTQPSASQEPASQPQSNAESGQPQQHPQLSSLSRQQSSQQGSQQYSPQLSQQLSQQAISESRQGPQWRRLSGGPEGAGFGGNRGSIWAMVASVGSLVPLSMQVSRISCSTCLVGASLLRALRCAVKGALASLTVCADMMPLLHVFQYSLVGDCVCPWPDLAKLMGAD